MPGSNIHSTGRFSQLIAKDIDKVFHDEYSRFPAQYEQVAKMQTENKFHTWKEGQTTGFQALQETNEGAPVPYDSFQQGNTKEVLFTKFSLGFQVTEEMMDDDLTGIIMKHSAELGKAAAYTKELEFWDMFNTGFTTTNRTGIDGKALFADDHPLVDGSGTIDNKATASLSQSSLEAAVTYFRNLVNERNIPIMMTPKILIVPPALEWKAKELMLSELTPESGNNAINAVGREPIKFMVVNFLTSSTAWFLISDEHDLRFIWRKQLALQQSSDFNTGNLLNKATMRFTTNFWDYRGAYGSSGA